MNIHRISPSHLAEVEPLLQSTLDIISVSKCVKLLDTHKTFCRNSKNKWIFTLTFFCPLTIMSHYLIQCNKTLIKFVDVQMFQYCRSMEKSHLYSKHLMHLYVSQHLLCYLIISLNAFYIPDELKIVTSAASSLL